MTIARMSNNVSDALQRIDKEISNIIIQISDEIQEMQRDRLFAGKLADDNQILPQYTPLTRFLKARKGQPFDRVTLLDEGYFYADIFVQQNNEELIIDSKDSKSLFLQEKYSDKIFGLTKNNKNDLKEEVNDMLVKYIKERMSL